MVKKHIYSGNVRDLLYFACESKIFKYSKYDVKSLELYYIGKINPAIIIVYENLRV